MNSVSRDDFVLPIPYPTMILWPIPYPADIWILYPATNLELILNPAGKKGLIPHPAKPHRGPLVTHATKYLDNNKCLSLNECIENIVKSGWPYRFHKFVEYFGCMIYEISSILLPKLMWSLCQQLSWITATLVPYLAILHQVFTEEAL